MAVERERNVVARPAAVAGTFYPADPERLRSTVRTLLDAAAAPNVDPVALIVPHAGYVYSGPIAASAYGLLRRSPRRWRRVILLGPAHRVAVRGVAATSATHFETPLGRVPIDGEAVAAALELPQVKTIDAAHAAEHSLEVQLPFLQCVLDAFTVAPFAVGDAAPNDVARLIDRLWRDDATLVIVSSDLSHYFDYDTARKLDAATTAAIESLDGDALDVGSACGRVPIQGMLDVARARGLTPLTLDVRNSGDTAGGRDDVVVGYGAWAFERR